jgi:hypothetical protein
MRTCTLQTSPWVTNLLETEVYKEQIKLSLSLGDWRTWLKYCWCQIMSRSIAIIWYHTCSDDAIMGNRKSCDFLIHPVVCLIAIDRRETTLATVEDRSPYCPHSQKYNHCTLYKQLIFDHTLMRKGSVGRSCRPMDLKYFSCGVVHQGISRRVLRGAAYDPGHWTFYFVEGDLVEWLASLIP